MLWILSGCYLCWGFLVAILIGDSPNNDVPSFTVPSVIPWVFFLICLYILFVPLLIKPTELLVAIAVISSGIPFYFVFVRWRDKPDFIYDPWSEFNFRQFLKYKIFN
jgi:hypothetical protein